MAEYSPPIPIPVTNRQTKKNSTVGANAVAIVGYTPSVIMNSRLRPKIRTTEIVKKAQDSLVPRLSEMPGFGGYYLIDGGRGVCSSVSIFDTEAHAEASTRVVSTWVREEKLETALTDPPRITSGQVVVRESRELVAV